MAPKRAAIPDPPAAVSSSEEDDSSDADQPQPQNDVVAKKPQFDDEEEEDPEEDDDEEDDEEEDEEEEETKKQPNAPNPDSDPDSSSDTESDAAHHSPTASDFTIKPIVSKSIPGPTKKPAAASSGAKRVPGPDPSPKKRRNMGPSISGEEEDTKKGRLWGEDGEVAILQGMIDFRAKNGADPSSNMTEFHEFLRGSLKADVSKSQLSDKVRRLKKKYYHGDEEVAPVFAKGHEMKLVELSKRVWGVEACKNNGVGVNGVGNSSSSKKKLRKSRGAKAKEEEEEDDYSVSPVLALPVSYLPAEKSVVSEKKSKNKKKVLDNGDANVNVNVLENCGDAADEDEGEKGFWSRYPALRDSVELGKRGGMEDHFRRTLPSIGNSNAKMLDARWSEVQLLETELIAKKLALQKEQADLIVDALKSQRG